MSEANYCFICQTLGNIVIELHHEKTGSFAYAETKMQISCAVTAQLISTLVFATQIVQSLFFLNLKFQVSSHLLWLFSLVCVIGNPEDCFSDITALLLVHNFRML